MLVNAMYYGIMTLLEAGNGRIAICTVIAKQIWYNVFKNTECTEVLLCLTIKNVKRNVAK